MKTIFIMLSGFLIVSGYGEEKVANEQKEVEVAEKGVILAVEGEVIPMGKVLIYESNRESEDQVTLTRGEQHVRKTVTRKETEKRSVKSIGEGKYRYIIVESKTTDRTTYIGKEPIDEETMNPVEGIAIIAEKNTDGTWTTKLERGEATEEVEDELKRIAIDLKNRDAQIYGTVRRKVGDRWEAPGAEMLGLIGAEGSLKFKFDSIEDFGGESCAKLTGTYDLSGTLEREGQKEIKTRMTGDFVIFRSIKHRVDRQTKLSKNMELSRELEPQAEIKMSMKLEGKGQSIITNELKDAE